MNYGGNKRVHFFHLTGARSKRTFKVHSRVSNKQTNNNKKVHTQEGLSNKHKHAKYKLY